MLNLTPFEIALLVLGAVLIAALGVILWWHLAGDRVKALIAGWLALPLFWKIVLPVVFGAFVLHGSVKRGEVVGDSCSGRKDGENSALQLQLNTTTTTPSFLQSSTVSSGLFRTTGFKVDLVNRILEFAVAWDDDLFDYTLSRNLFLYSSTNLLERRWTWLNTYSMPHGTNAHTFAISLSNYNWASSAFFQFGLDVDFDNDNLKDSYERLCTLTDPANPDSDGDGILDGHEIALGLDPLVPVDSFLDLDGDGLTHKQELELGSDPMKADSDGDGLDDATEHRYGWDPNWPGEINEANAPGGVFTVFDRPFTASVKFENPYEEATVYGVSEGSHTVVLSDMVTRDAHKDTASTVTNNIITVTTLDPKPIFTTNVTGVLIVKLKCDDYGVIKIGDLAVTNSWPNTEFVKAWKVIEANTTNEVDVVWDSKGGSKWNFEYECYFYPEKPQGYSIDLDVDSDNNGIIEDGEDSIEDHEGKPGKALYLNELDKDYDGVPDYADGYDIDFGTGMQALNNVSGSFASMRLSINGPETNGFVKLVCVDIDSTANVTRSGDGTLTNEFIYSKADSKIRIWKKDGVSARSKAPFPEGDLIQADTLYDVMELLDSGVGEFFVEAINGSEDLGDVTITAEFYPAQEGCCKVDDKVKMTVFSIDAVHPIAADFAAGSIGKVMISTKQDAAGTNRYYTVNPTTASREGAQTKDANVTISAYVKPVPTVPIPNLSVRFELVDPDDLSHYEGKAVAGMPSVQGDIMPNDNNDPNGRMLYSASNLCGYHAFQNRLSGRAVVPTLVVCETKTNYIAETVLSITDRYSGDNYRVRATLVDNSLQPFDTLSNVDKNAKVYKSSVKESETLIAWKRFYIEQDEMYKKGCTVVRDFVYDPASSQQILCVDSTNDFHKANAQVIVFWKGGEARNITLKSCGAGSIIVSGLTNSVSKFAGVRIAGEDETYTVDRRYLPNAFGACPNGSDGGAFMEFRFLEGLKNKNSYVPKYNVFPNADEEEEFAKYWFDNVAEVNSNVIYLLAAKCEANSSLGVTFRRNNKKSCTVYVESCSSTDQCEETVVHEFGHALGLVPKSGRFLYIDQFINNEQNHAGSDFCIMGYQNIDNGIVEFSSACLLTGSFDDREDSLRKSEDK